MARPSHSFQDRAQQTALAFGGAGEEIVLCSCDLGCRARLVLYHAICRLKILLAEAFSAD